VGNVKPGTPVKEMVGQQAVFVSDPTQNQLDRNRRLLAYLCVDRRIVDRLRFRGGWSDVNVDGFNSFGSKMIGSRGTKRFFLLGLIGIATFSGSLCSAGGAQAASLEATRVDIGPPPLAGVVRFEGRSYPAGISDYRIRRELTVPAFALSLGQNEFGADLYDIFPEGNGLSNMPELEFLTERWAKSSSHFQAVRFAAAAFQVAIWHESAGLPIEPGSVPSGAIRRYAKRLVDSANTEDQYQGEKCEEESCGEDSIAPELQARVGDSTISNQIIEIELGLGNLEKSFNEFQAIDLRLNGAYASICTGTNTHIEPTQPYTGTIPPCASGSGKGSNLHYPQEIVADYRCIRGRFESGTCTLPDPRDRHCAEGKIIEGVCNLGMPNRSQTGNATISFPREQHIEYVQLVWRYDLGPSDVFEPADTGVPIMTARGGPLMIHRTVRLNPSSISGLGNLLQTILVAHIAHWGAWGLLVLVLIVALTLNFAGLIAFTAKELWARPRLFCLFFWSVFFIAMAVAIVAPSPELIVVAAPAYLIGLIRLAVWAPVATRSSARRAGPHHQ
jgi:hypothetical protein